MECALRIAEEHMPQIESGGTKTMLAAVPSTTEDEQSSSEKPKADHLSPGEVHKLRTLLSQTGKAAGDCGSQHTSGTKSQRPDSGHDSEAKGWQSKHVQYAELPDCCKCCGKHPGADKGECHMFDSISTIMEKNCISGASKHRAMAARLMEADREGEESGEEFRNESKGGYSVFLPVPSPDQRIPCVYTMQFTVLSRAGLNLIKVLITAQHSTLTEWPCTYIDSASQGHIMVHDRYVWWRLGRKLKLLGVTGNAATADKVEISISTPSSLGTHVFPPEGQSMVVTTSKDNILSHALLQKQGYNITLC
eukprot:642396-Rhodomonas_salina.1